MMPAYVVLLLLVGVQPLDVTAAREPAVPGEALIAANAAYSEGDFAAAAEAYADLIATGHDHGLLHYNLGNALLRRGDLARAIAAYLRAAAREPRNEDVLANLAFARRSVKDAIAPPAPSAIVKTLFFWHYSSSRSELLWIVVAVNALFWAVLALRLFGRGSELLLWLGAGLLVVLVATGASLGLRVWSPQRVGVVVPIEVDARSGYGDDAVVRFKLHSGTEVRVDATVDGWTRIALPDGERGWVRRESLEVVEL